MTLHKHIAELNMTHTRTNLNRMILFKINIQKEIILD